MFLKKKKINKGTERINTKLINKRKLIFIIAMIATVAIVVSSIFFLKNRTNELLLTPEIIRSKAYEIAKESDNKVSDVEGNIIDSIHFDAYFIKDLDGDGVAESRLRGNCSEIGESASLFMDLSVENNGRIKNAKITINSQNFTFQTALLKDDLLANDYISDNTKELVLNEIQNSMQKNIMGSIKANVGYTDTTNLSKENSITFSGTYVDSEGKEVEFKKEVKFMVDWYGEVNCNMITNLNPIIINAMEDLKQEGQVVFNFPITTYESKNSLPMQEASISGTIPEINGYKPTSVVISGTNVTYTYEEETGRFTAKREAVLDENGKITQNAYSYRTENTRRNNFYCKVTYPEEVYETIKEGNSIGIEVPIEASNKGYNNPNEEFENPYVSNIAKDIIHVIFRVRQYGPSFCVYIGDYKGSPYYTYTISKNKPLNLYHHISEKEENDIYTVRWEIYTGNKEELNSLVMKEPKNTEDTFQTMEGTHLSMDEYSKAKAIYFSGAQNTLGQDGWIRVYDAQTNTLIKEFNASNWNLYTRANPYQYETPVNHIKVETSSAKTESIFVVYQIKELDDEAITENFTEEEFTNLKYIETNFYGEANSATNKYSSGNLLKEAFYMEPTSIANISIRDSYITNKETKENEIITITTDTTSYNTQGWKNGTFLVQLPSDIIVAEINNITTNNENVKVLAYDLYKENENYYLKILTENNKPESFSIKIDCNLTPDPRMPRKTLTFKLYATNEIASQYYYAKEDIYDMDGDLNTNEKVNYREANLTVEVGTGLNTTQLVLDYDNAGSITFAPNIAITDKDRGTAKIEISATNNYTTGIKDVKIMGVIPFEGNNNIVSKKDMGSNYTTYLTEDLVQAKTEKIKGKYTIYYSEKENPTQDVQDPNNGWTVKEEIQNIENIKTYLIVFHPDYTFYQGDSIEFTYNINIPKEVNYNQIAFAQHAIYYGLMTEEGLYYTSASVAKVGILVAKQYDLEIVKYQTEKEKTIAGVTFTLTEEGQETSSIKTTDANGKLIFRNLLAERYYVLKEQKTTEDYELSKEEIRFYTETKTKEDGTKQVYVLSDKDNLETTVENTYQTIRKKEILEADDNNKADYKVQLEIENDPKVKLAITKTNQETNEPLRNATFKLTGEGKEETIVTNQEGKINVSGLILNKEYTLEEIKLKDYYLPSSPIKFTIERNNGTFEISHYQDNGTTKTRAITIEDEIPTVNLELQNEKIPSYTLQLTKYAKGENEQNGQAKTLAGAQYQIWGEGISEKGKIYQTDEHGILTIPNLYEYIEGKYITGEYTLKEIYAPEGYSVNSTEFKFRALRDETGTLKIEIKAGKEIIRTITEGTETKEDLSISKANSKNPIIEMGVEDAPIFSILKYTEEGGIKTPIPGAKFKITDLDGNYVIGTDGKIVEELITNEKGIITANLPEGYYKAVEVAVGDRYELPEKEENRTYYFGIGASKPASCDWKNGILGRGWNYINGVEASKDGGVIAVGSFSEYPNQIVIGAINGIDIDGDGIIEQESQGDNDGIIIRYDAQGEPLWSKSFGGNKDDALNKVIQTKDEGYMAVGYVSSKDVMYDGKKIEELSKSYTSDGTFGQKLGADGKPILQEGEDATPDSTIKLANKDAVMLKLDKNGNYEWGIRLGGLQDEEIKSVIQTSNENFVVIGNYNSKTFHVCEKGSTETKKELTNTTPENTVMVNNAFIACYSALGTYNWAATMGSTSTKYNVVDVKEYSDTLAIAVNEGTTAKLYKLKLADGTKIGNAITFSSNAKITSLDIMKDTIIAGVNVTSNTFNANIYKIPWNATSVSNSNILYTLKGEGTTSSGGGNYDEYVSSVKVTSKGSILLGGWYYSEKGLDVDVDGSLEGKFDFPSLEGENTSDGFVIQIDETGKVEYASRLYGDGYEGVTSVTQTKSGGIISGGYFNGTTLTATNYEQEEQNSDEEGKQEDGIKKVTLFKGKGNSEGFVLSEGASGAAIAEAQSLEVENKIKTFKITTQVIKNNNELGGTITGDIGTIGGQQYTEDGIRYVETVTYGNNATKEIIITPNTNYNIDSITINGEKKTDYIQNADGTVTLPIFEEVKENIHVTVTFSNTISNIEINHYLWKETIESSTEKIVPTETRTGKVGDSYTALPAVGIDYDIITNLDYYKEGNVPEGKNAEDLYIPDNAKGTYETGKKEIINYYYKEKTYTLIVHYYLEGTNEQVPLKNGNLGQTVEDIVTENLKKGSSYQTEKAGEDKIDYGIYKLVQVPENAKGTIEGNTEVFYYYQVKTTNVTFTKVAEEDHSKTIQGTQFALYQYVGTKKEETNELIDKNNVDLAKWKLVKNLETSNIGTISFENLPITGTYRLVEIKPSEGRLEPNGQWKIEFTSVSEEETKIMLEEGIYLTITAIGNPPAFAIEEGKLLIPNTECFHFPTSGAIGIKGFYQTGLTIIAIGGILLFLRKLVLAKSASKSKHSKKGNH